MEGFPSGGFNSFFNVGGHGGEHPEFEHPEMEHPEIEHPEIEHPEMEGFPPMAGNGGTFGMGADQTGQGNNFFPGAGGFQFGEGFGEGAAEHSEDYCPMQTVENCHYP